MKLKKFILIILIFNSLKVFSQKNDVSNYVIIDKKVMLIPDSLTKTTNQIANYISSNFQNENEKIRAIFYWVASTIQYDIDNMFALNFYEKKEEKISKSLLTKKGICENYAALFTDICIKSGIKSYIIEGYTKQNGFADYIPHAWNAALVNNSWVLFDPTWGSGYINNGKFVKKINNDYFKVSPITLIKSHMPFDYLWQFLNYPITNQEFYEGKIKENQTKTFFNFIDSIKLFENQNNSENINASLYRIEKNGIKNSLIFDRIQHLKLSIENEKNNNIINLYNTAVADCNSGINSLNEFINYKNKQFTPKKTDLEIQNMIDIAENKFYESKNKLQQIIEPDANTQNLIKQLLKTIEDASIPLKEHQDWLKQYFSKNKAGRKAMFYKVTWFGMPVN